MECDASIFIVSHPLLSCGDDGLAQQQASESKQRRSIILIFILFRTFYDISCVLELTWVVRIHVGMIREIESLSFENLKNLKIFLVETLKLFACLLLAPFDDSTNSLHSRLSLYFYQSTLREY